MAHQQSDAIIFGENLLAIAASPQMDTMLDAAGFVNFGTFSTAVQQGAGRGQTPSSGQQQHPSSSSWRAQQFEQLCLQYQEQNRQRLHSADSSSAGASSSSPRHVVPSRASAPPRALHHCAPGHGQSSANPKGASAANRRCSDSGFGSNLSSSSLGAASSVVSGGSVWLPPPPPYPQRQQQQRRRTTAPTLASAVRSRSGDVKIHRSYSDSKPYLYGSPNNGGTDASLAYCSGSSYSNPSADCKTSLASFYCCSNFNSCSNEEHVGPHAVPSCVVVATTKVAPPPTRSSMATTSSSLSSYRSGVWSAAASRSPSPSMSTVSCPEYGNLQDKLNRLESDRESLSLQVSVLNEQVGAQTEKIKDLESLLDDKVVRLDSTEEMLHEELLTRTNLETNKLDLLTEISTLKLKLTSIQREKIDSEQRMMHAQSEIGKLQKVLHERQTDVYRLNHVKQPTCSQISELEELRSAIHQLMLDNEEKDQKIAQLKAIVGTQPPEMEDGSADLNGYEASYHSKNLNQFDKFDGNGHFDLNAQLRHLLSDELFDAPQYISRLPSSCSYPIAYAEPRLPCHSSSFNTSLSDPPGSSRLLGPVAPYAKVSSHGLMVGSSALPAYTSLSMLQPKTDVLAGRGESYTSDSRQGVIVVPPSSTSRLTPRREPDVPTAGAKDKLVGGPCSTPLARNTHDGQHDWEGANTNGVFTKRRARVDAYCRGDVTISDRLNNALAATLQSNDDVIGKITGNDDVTIIASDKCQGMQMRAQLAPPTMACPVAPPVDPSIGERLSASSTPTTSMTTPTSKTTTALAAKQLAAELNRLTPPQGSSKKGSAAPTSSLSLPRFLSLSHKPPIAPKPSASPAASSSSECRQSRSTQSRGLKWLKEHFRPNKRSTSAPNFDRRKTTECESLSNSDDETVNSANQFNENLKRNKKQRSVRNFISRLKRSTSQEARKFQTSDSAGNFRRNDHTRHTVGPRVVGWSKEIASDEKVPLRPHYQQFCQWGAETLSDWLNELGLNFYLAECQRNIKSGRHLMSLTQNDLDKELNMRNHLHRKKLLLALRSIEFGKSEPCDSMDYHQVLRWLDDIGLPQYRDVFAENRVDGSVLNILTVDDLLYMHVNNAVHHSTLSRGLEILREVDFNLNRLQRKFNADVLGKGPIPNAVQFWTQHFVSEWLRTIDLAEFTPNLMCAGVHGALIVLEPTFTADSLASILNISQQKSLLRRHLSMHFNQLLGTDVITRKRHFLARPGATELMSGMKVKPCRNGSVASGRKKSRSEICLDPDNLICPLTPSRRPSNSSTKNSLNSEPISETLLARLESSNV